MILARKGRLAEQEQQGVIQSATMHYWYPLLLHHTKETFDALKCQNLESKENLDVAKEDRKIDLQKEIDVLRDVSRLLEPDACILDVHVLISTPSLDRF